MDRPWIAAGLKYSAIQHGDCPSLLVQRVTRLRATDHINASYLRYVVGGRDFTDYILAIQTGTAVPHISGRQIKAFEFSLPELPEQQAIASVLSTLDDKIELNRRMNETLEAQARALFRDWFVDFGPVKAKMANQIANTKQAGTAEAGATIQAPYLSDEIWSLFPSALDDDGKPEGWRETTAGELFNITIGRTPPRKEQHHFVSGKAGVPWLSIKTMGNDTTFIFETAEGLTPESVRACRVPVVKAGSVLLSFKLTVGRVVFAGVDMATNEAIAHFNRPNDCQVSDEYTYLSLKEFDFARLGSTSSIATAVNSKSIRSIPFLVPPASILKAFHSLIKGTFAQIRNITLESRTLAETRDLLLPKLMSGEIRVAQAAREIEAVL